MWTCRECGQQYENPRSGSNHVRWHHRKIKFSNEAIIKRAESNRKTADRLFGEKITIEKNCLVCNTKFSYERNKNSKNKKQDRITCSKTCTAKLSSSFVDKNNISKSMKVFIRNNPDHPFLQTWKSEKRYTSKNEILIRAHFIGKDDWTFGTIAHYKFTQLNPDLWSRRHKIVFEYDGIWHFKDIHGQLRKKKLKDKLLEIWCSKNGYRLIRISEEKFKEKEFEYWIKFLENEFFNGTQSILKIY